MKIYLDNCCYNAERFISAVIKESSNYTEFRKTLFKGMTLDQIVEEASAYDEENPFTGAHDGL